MNALLKVDPKRLPLPKLKPTHSCRINYAQDKDLRRMKEHHDRVFNWNNADREKKPGRKSPTVWTPRRTAELVRLYNSGKNNGEIADELHLSRRSVEAKVCSLRKSGKIQKTIRTISNGWKEEEVDRAVRMYNEGRTCKEISEVLGRTHGACQAKIFELRKKGRCENHSVYGGSVYGDRSS